MKKILYILVFAILLVISLIWFISSLKEKNNNKETKLVKISLAEVTHSPFYAPLYIAKEKGYFEDAGLDVTITLVSGANNVAAAVLSGDVNIGFCGPEATIYIYEAGEKDYIRSFAGLTKRDGQFIVSRKEIKDFNYKMLEGREVLAGRKAGMPELNFENALKNSGIEKDKVKINTSVDFASLSSAFISGQGDFVNLFEPNATKLVDMGLGYVVSSVGEKSGEMPYTAFNAKKSYIEKNKKQIISFTKAINRGLEFVKENTSEEIAKVILNEFPDTSLSDLTKIIDRYKDADSWLDNSYISEEMFTNLEDLIIDAGELDKYVPYENLIKNMDID